MPDFRVSDTAAEHRKLRAAGLPAAGLWSMAGAWAMRELTDGWVPDYWVDTWPSGRKHARTLVSVGLWHPEKRDGISGFAFHDWPDYQRSARQFESDRYTARLRRELYSSPELVSGIKLRDRDQCRYCGVTVSWGNRRGSSGGTLDYVIPPEHGGTNAADNVVVACRACQSAKRTRTPEQAGMSLRDPPAGTSSGTRTKPEPNKNRTRTKPDRNQNGPSTEPVQNQNVLSTEQEYSGPPHPHPRSGYFGGESSGSRTRTSATSPPKADQRPPERCAQHADSETDPGPCGGCAAARERAERWDDERSRRAAEQRSLEARQRATARQQAAAGCGLCDDDGRLPGGGLCRHDPAAVDRAKRGIALVRAALSKPDTDDAEEGQA